MSDDVHIVRDPGALRARRPLEALCGAKAPKDGNLTCGTPDMASCWQCILLQCGRPIPPEPPVPEHERLEKAKKTDDATTLVGEFFDWLVGEKGYSLGKYLREDHEFLTPIHESVHKLLAEFFGINQNALESEKRALLDHIRAVSKAREWAMNEGRQALRRR